MGDIGLQLGFQDDNAAHSSPMTEEDRRQWYGSHQHVSMMAFLLDGVFDGEIRMQLVGEWEDMGNAVKVS